MHRLVILALCALAVCAACQRPVGEGPCNGPANCQSEVCLDIAHESYCTQRCGQCPDGMYCDGVLFANAGIAICINGHSQLTPAMPPRMRCAADGECPGGTVCAGPQGDLQCAAECQRDADCGALSVGGQTFAYLACTDQAGPPPRRACLPRPECRANLIVCLFSPEPMPGTEFAGVLEALTKAGDLQARSVVVLGPQTEARYFSSAQLLAVMKIFHGAGDDPIVPLRSMGPRLVEKSESAQILDLLGHGEHQDEARRILGLNGQ